MTYVLPVAVIRAAVRSIWICAGSSPVQVIVVPDDGVEDQIAKGRFRWAAVQDQLAAETETSRGGRREPGVVALRGAGGDERRRARGECLGAAVLQLADLVASAAEADQVVPFDPQIVRPQTQRRGESGRAVHRCRPLPQHERGRSVSCSVCPESGTHVPLPDLIAASSGEPSGDRNSTREGARHLVELWRWRRDLNPRRLSPHTLSRRAP